jgi:hypothetical protein
MDIRPHEQQLLTMEGYVQSMQVRSIACTGIVDGRIICCGGVIPYQNGNADIWLIPSVYVSTVKMTFTKELKKWLFGVRNDLCLNRMQSYCLDDELHNRWMRFLGFEREGLARKYHQGKDYALFGRIWE